MKKTWIIVVLIVIFLGIGSYEFYNIKKREQRDIAKSKIENIENGKNITKSNGINEKTWNVKPFDIEQEQESFNNEKAKDFTLENLNGESISLNKLKGKTVFLNFWASWCTPCQIEMPDLEKLYEHTKNNKDFEIVTINVGESKSNIEKFIRDNGYTFNVLIDKDSNVAKEYSAYALPTSIVIDKEGNIANYRKGAMNYEQMIEFIKKANNS